MVASGFGMNIKLIGSFHPDPQTGQLTTSFVDLPQLPFETFELHLFASDRALMATPDRLHDLHRQRRHVPLERDGGRSDLHPGLRPRTRVLTAPSAPARFAPSSRACRPAPPTPAAGGFSSFTLKLDREDGDQFLGHLNFTMPPGLTANLHGITYCPEASDHRSGADPGQSRAGDPELPGLEPDRHQQCRGRPWLAPLPRRRQDLPGRPLPGSSAEPRRDHPGPRRPL